MHRTGKYMNAKNIWILILMWKSEKMRILKWKKKNVWMKELVPLFHPWGELKTQKVD